MPEHDTDGPKQAYTRCEAIAAMMKHSAAAGVSATTTMTADGLVSEASAYPPGLQRLCRTRPNHRLCTWYG